VGGIDKKKAFELLTHLHSKNLIATEKLISYVEELKHLGV
jgi:hypothetical protein